MPFQNRFMNGMNMYGMNMNGMNTQGLGVGQMLGQRIAPMTGGPGMALSVNSPMGAGPSMGGAPSLPQAQEEPLDINNLGGLLGMLGKGLDDQKDQPPVAEQAAQAAAPQLQSLGGHGITPEFSQAYPQAGFNPFQSLWNPYGGQ